MLKANNFHANAVVLATVLLLGLVAAVIVGDSVASGRYALIGAAILIIFGIPLGLKLGNNFWLLIVLSIAADGRLPFIPVPFNLSEICTIVAAGLFMLHVVLRRIALKTPMQWVDIVVLLNVAWLVVTFVKNPTGLNFLGSDMVGGRKYINIAFAFVVYFIISRCRIPNKWAYYLPLWIAVGMAIPSALQTVAAISADFGQFISYVYGVQVSVDSATQPTQAGTNDVSRLFGAENVALPLFLALCAYYAPVTFINPLYPLRLSACLVTAALVGLSGYRSALLSLIGYVVISTWLRGRISHLLPLTAAAVIVLITLISGIQSGLPIPQNMQRALSFLPVGFDTAAVQSAEQTTAWRVDMWRDAWNDPNYFKDKIFGDGFGYTYQEMMLFANQMQGMQGLTGGATYEMFIIRGSLHNGPLSSLRYGGFIGLVLLLTLMASAAFYSVKVVNASLGTTYFPMAVFVAIPLIYTPFAFFVIFGAYDNQLIQYFVGVGMLNLINRSLPHPVGTAAQSRKQAIPERTAVPSPADRTVSSRVA